MAVSDLYAQYTSRYGQLFDPAAEYEAIRRNVQDPGLRNEVLNWWRMRNPSAMEWSQRYTDTMGNVRNEYYNDMAAQERYNSGAAGGWAKGLEYNDNRSPFVQAATQQSTAPTQRQQSYAPSALASQESGAIGAASIASQMAGAPKPQQKPQVAKQQPYKVQRGDTLSAIAKKNKMTVAQILKLNPKFKQQAKYQGGRTIFSGTKVNLAPKPAPKKKPSPFSPGQFRMAEERSMRQPTPTLQNPLGK